MPKSQTLADIVDLRIARFDAVVSSKVMAHTIAQRDILNIKNGEIMELFCTAHGRPLPEINWYKDGALVTSRSPSNNFMISKFGATSALRINDMRISDSGTYACQADNINGHIRKWVFVTVAPKMILSTNSMTTVHSKSKLKKYVPKSLCEANPCNIGECLEKDNGSSYHCKCKFPYNGDNCENNILFVGNKKNFSAFGEKSIICNKKSNISVNDQLFTIFETILVCIIASLFLGIICYIFRRKYCCVLTKSKMSLNRNSQSIQAEINNFILVRDVGINVHGHYFEHGCDRLMPVAYKRNTTMNFQDSRFQEISQVSRLLTSHNSTLSSPILYEDSFETSQYPPCVHPIINNVPTSTQSIYYNRSIIQDCNNGSSNEELNIIKINESESGICSCFDYSSNMHLISSTLLIFNEALSPSLSYHESRNHTDNELTNVVA